jgi:uncharacterized membrane protein
MSKFKENGSRSLVKSITFRIIVVCADGIIVYLITNRLDLALSIMIVRNIIATVLYWGHERAWNSIEWGRK